MNIDRRSAHDNLSTAARRPPIDDHNSSGAFVPHTRPVRSARFVGLPVSREYRIQLLEQLLLNIADELRAATDLLAVIVHPSSTADTHPSSDTDSSSVADVPDSFI